MKILNVRDDIPTVRVPSEEYMFLTEMDADRYAHWLLKHVQESVSDIIREGGISCSFYQEIGHPDETIARFAEQHDADLIVLGSRGLGGFARMLVGSVSNNVAYHANCPVLLVR